jgi:uncharacterized radical SAM superfamily protein
MPTITLVSCGKGISGNAVRIDPISGSSRIRLIGQKGDNGTVASGQPMDTSFVSLKQYEDLMMEINEIKAMIHYMSIPWWKRIMAKLKR